MSNFRDFIPTEKFSHVYKIMSCRYRAATSPGRSMTSPGRYRQSAPLSSTRRRLLPYRPREELQRMSLEDLEFLLDDADIDLTEVARLKPIYIAIYTENMDSPRAASPRRSYASPSRRATSPGRRYRRSNTNQSPLTQPMRPGRLPQRSIEELREMSLDELLYELDMAGVDTNRLTQRKPVLIEAYLQKTRK